MQHKRVGVLGARHFTWKPAFWRLSRNVEAAQDRRLADTPIGGEGALLRQVAALDQLAPVAAGIANPAGRALAQFVFTPASFRPGKFAWAVEMASPPGFGLGEPESCDPPGDPEREPAGTYKYVVALHFGNGYRPEEKHEHEADHVRDLDLRRYGKRCHRRQYGRCGSPARPVPRRYLVRSPRSTSSIR
jgi:hypothetical protein